MLYAAASLSAADWPNWRGPANNGISAETDWQTEWPAAGPKVLWKAPLGTGFSSFAVAEGRVFTMGNVDDQDSVICLDADGGKELWRHTYPQPIAPKLYEGGPNASPAVDGSRVFSLSRNGKLFCLDAETGKVNWSKDLVKEFGIKVPDWGLSGSPLVQGNLVVVNAGRAGMAFEKESGKLIWETGKDAAGYASPVPMTIRGQKAVLVFGGKALVALALATGSELWAYPWETSYDINAADPIVDGSRVFISSGYGHGAALLDVSGDQPELVWENKNMRNKMNGSVLVEGHVYGCDEKKLTCVDVNTGEKKWANGASGQGSLMAANGTLIILSEKGELIVAEASPEAFTPISRAQVLGGKCWTVPVLANGRIYARNAEGGMVCLDVSGK
jgi:outer membrane protein assembly factor BamB